MFSFKQALKNVVRIPGRSILLGVIMFIITASVFVGLSIKAGTNKSITETRKKLGNDVTIQVDEQNLQKKFMESMQKGEEPDKIKIDPLTEKIVDKYKNSKYVKDYNYTSEMSLTTNLKAVGENNETNKNTKGIVINGKNGEKSKEVEIEMPKIKLIGDSNPKYQSDFKNGDKKIVKGRFYNEEEIKNKKPVVVVSKLFADLNKLKVGDTIEVRGLEDKKVKKLKIIGLYEDSVQEDMSIPIPFMYRANTMYSPISTVNDMFTKNSKDKIIKKATYFVDDPINIESFKKEIKDSGLNLENYAVDANDTEYKKLVGPLEKLNSFMDIFLIIVVASGGAVMILLMTLTTRERKMEIGVLRALGVKKRKIALQIIIETLLITTLALGAGGIAGKAISQKTGQYLLQKEITAQKKVEDENKKDPFGGSLIIGETNNKKSESVKPIDDIDTVVGTKEILALILVGLFIASCGSIASSYWIMKYEPMNILNNRN
ncbi:ABC transporter permease [Haloimpatiens sp. FM7330]|uniref:ABC transporter permease n=1 Tax=Haloimpatiens sp. FM7330 TaxID=3298610 RepID=UPI003637AD72